MIQRIALLLLAVAASWVPASALSSHAQPESTDEWPGKKKKKWRQWVFVGDGKCTCRYGLMLHHQDGSTVYKTLAEAQAPCEADPECTGITYFSETGTMLWYPTNQSTVPARYYGDCYGPPADNASAPWMPEVYCYALVSK